VSCTIHTLLGQVDEHRQPAEELRGPLEPTVKNPVKNLTDGRQRGEALEARARDLRGNHTGYVRQLTTDAAKLARQHLLLPEYARRLIDLARQAAVVP
jgi:hypothetical protein